MMEAEEAPCLTCLESLRFRSLPPQNGTTRFLLLIGFVFYQNFSISDMLSIFFPNRVKVFSVWWPLLRNPGHNCLFAGIKIVLYHILALFFFFLQLHYKWHPLFSWWAPITTLIEGIVGFHPFNKLSGWYSSLGFLLISVIGSHIDVSIFLRVTKINKKKTHITVKLFPTN